MLLNRFLSVYHVIHLRLYQLFMVELWVYVDSYVSYPLCVLTPSRSGAPSLEQGAC